VTALSLAAVPAPRRCHAPREEYFGWLDDVFGEAPRTRGRDRVATIKSRRYFYNRFVKYWPELEEWFAAPLFARLDLGPDGVPTVAPRGKRVGRAPTRVLTLSTCHWSTGCRWMLTGY
jgi:hypothetical protein